MPEPAIREARLEDLPRLVELLEQLSLEGESREDASAMDAYVRAFRDIAADQRQQLLVIESEGVVVGTAAVIFVPNLSRIGRPYAVVEGVVVDSTRRDQGLGEELMRHVMEMARSAGCYKIILTSNKAREGAHRFYRRLGFKASHEGFSLYM
jgi:N-acetylglutamate synthase-like GNAT family acetyltransferase